MKSRTAVGAVVLSGVLWGVISIFIRGLSSYGFSSLDISAIMMVTSAAVFAVFLAIYDRSLFRIRLKDIWMFIGTGIVSVMLFNVCYFYTMVQSEASVAVVLLYTSPIFVMLLSALLFKEKITAKKIAALVITFLGCVLVSGLFQSGQRLLPIVLLTGLLSGLFYALYSIFGRVALKKYRPFTVIYYTFLLGAVGSLPFLNIGSLIKTVSISPESLLWCLGIGMISTILPYLLYTLGLQNMDASKAAILVAVEPLVGSALGIVFYGESHGVLKIIGTLMILFAVVMLSIEKPQNKEGSI